MGYLPARRGSKAGLEGRESGGGGTAEPETERQILFLDAYDSFTNNIVSLIKDALGPRVRVHVLHMDLRTLDADQAHDWTAAQLLDRLPAFDAVVCGPGPGSPLHDADVGAFKLLWDLPPDEAVPVLGICLGFQSLVAHHGGRIIRLNRGLHGMVRPIDHAASDIFHLLPPFRATLYHSLCADLGQDAIPDDQWSRHRWSPFASAPKLQPLAWSSDPSAGQERILMAVRHQDLPLWGVQYHPESICTDPAARDLIRNWFRHAMAWNEASGRLKKTKQLDALYPDSLDPCSRALPGLGTTSDPSVYPWWSELRKGLAATGIGSRYICRTVPLPADADAAELAEALGLKTAAESIILESSSSVNGDPLAKTSVLALGVDAALRFQYHVGDDFVTLRQPATAEGEEKCQRISLGPAGRSPWSPWHVLAQLWRQRRIPDDGAAGSSSSPPFKGGFIGFVTYEMGLSTAAPNALPKKRGHGRPDICMVWVSRSVVLDHVAGVAYVQALVPSGSGGGGEEQQPQQQQQPRQHQQQQQEDEEGKAELWLKRTAEILLQCGARQKQAKDVAQNGNGVLLTDLPRREEDGGRLRFELPDASKYETQVERCQEAISRGESYELCLTAQSTMSRPRVMANGAGQEGKDGSEPRGPWQLYRALRRRQPAPFGSYVRLAGATMVGSSPERFLSHDESGLCSMRPMKGTVRKSDEVATLAQAEKLLHVPKEEAENLMIVDLVRHDLYGICGAGAVRVPDLLRVEEYATVFQMITAVQGQLPGEKLRGGPGQPLTVTGFDILASVLPPGSMTGAPKKRSCEILGEMEPCERSLYSGVVGYLDAQGRGDWSVTIRTLFRWDDEGERTEREVWRIGAGGAVTALSTPEGETDEMFTKLKGPLGVFRDVA